MATLIHIVFRTQTRGYALIAKRPLIDRMYQMRQNKDSKERVMTTSTEKGETTAESRKMLGKKAAVKLREINVMNFADIYRMMPTERIKIIKKGVSAIDVTNLAKSSGRTKARLFSVLGLRRATINRKMRANQRLSTEQGERVIGFSKLVGQVQLMVEQSGDPKGFEPAKWVANWLDRPLPALDGQCPADFMDTGEGQELISNLLMKMQSGAYT